MDRRYALLRLARQLFISPSVACFTAGAAAVSVIYMWTTVLPGYGEGAAVAFCAIALGVEMTKPRAVRAAFGAQGWPFVVPGILASLVCVSVSSYIEYQVMARGRAAFVEASTKPPKPGEQETAWRDELAALEPSRLSGELAALIRKERGRCRVDQPCPRADELEAEKARAERREELAEAIGSLTGERRPEKGTAEALALVDMLGLLGWHVEARTVDRLMVPALVALLQLAAVSAAALSVARHPGTPPPSVAEGNNRLYRPRIQGIERGTPPMPPLARHPGTDPPSAEPDVVDVVPADVPPTSHGTEGGTLFLKSGTQALLVEKLREAGGTLPVGDRTVGDLLGVGRTAAQNAIRALEEKGIVRKVNGQLVLLKP